MSHEAGKTQQKPRLLVLTSTYPRWSDDPEPSFVHELAKRLAKDFTVLVIAPHAPGAARRESLEEVEVYRYRYAPERLECLVNNGGILPNLKRNPWKWTLVPGFLYAMAWSTFRALGRYQPDVVHAHWLIPQGLIAALCACLRHMPPFVVTSHGADLYALRARPLRAIKAYVARRAQALTVVSQAMLPELEQLGVPADRAQVIPMGVDLQTRFTVDPNAARSSDEILCVGRLVEKKGIRYLIDAMPPILRTRPTAYLTIVGFGPEEQALRQQVRQLGLGEKVGFYGAMQQSELPALYRRAAVFVAPFVQTASGDQEGLPVALMEAIGCGCPVVAGSVAGLDDLFGPYTAEVTVDPRNPALLAERIVTTLNTPDEARARALAIRQRVREQLDWSQVAERYAALLADAAKRVCAQPEANPVTP